jgi:hypothetical protein
MNFDQLDECSYLVKQARNSGEDEKFKNLEGKIIDFILSENFMFPVEKKVLINDNSASFVYKGNKTFMNTFEFLSELLELNIPFHLNGCKFGPSEIIVAATSEENAKTKLQENTLTLQKMVRSKIIKRKE